MVQEAIKTTQQKYSKEGVKEGEMSLHEEQAHADGFAERAE